MNSAIHRLSFICALLAIVTFCMLAVGQAQHDGPCFVPGQVVVEFEPGVVDLPPNPGAKFIPIEDVPINVPGLRLFLQQQGIITFEIVARPWRWIDPGPIPDSLITDHIPATLKSFRDIYILHFPAEYSLEGVVELLEAREGIRSVGRNPRIHPAQAYWPPDTLLVCPDSCGRNYQWNMANTGGTINGVSCTEGVDIGLQDAYAIQETCVVKVGVIDSGVDRNHDDLADNLDDVLGRNFTTDPADTMAWDDGGPWAGHGTGVAGIIGGIHSWADSFGVAGTCGLIRENEPVIVPMKVLDNCNVPPPDPCHSDSASNQSSWFIEALAYAGGLFPQIPIVSASLAMLDYAHGTAYNRLTDAEVALQRDAVYNAYHQGLFMVVAAGNDELLGLEATNWFPAGFRRMVVGIGALGCDGSVEGGYYSGHNIDLAAPGTANDTGSDNGKFQIVTTADGGGFFLADPLLFGGTSAATPHVSGVAALLLSHTSSLTNEDLRELLQRTAWDRGDAGYDHETGHGLVRADSALMPLDSFLVVHDSTSSIGSWSRVAACTCYSFKNIQTIGSPSVNIGEDYVDLMVDVYEFEKTVSLNENTNASHVPMLWVRGRQTVSARDTVNYDGKFEPYSAEVVSVSATSATLRGHAFKIYGESAPCVNDSLKGWFPLNPTMGSMSTVFSYTYLADTTSGGGRVAPPSSSLKQLRAPKVLRKSRGEMMIRYFSPAGAGGELEVFDTTGRKVGRVVLPAGEPGWNDVAWNGAGNDGARLPVGLYFGRVKVSGLESRVRFLIVR